MERVRITYRLAVDANRIERRADELALEQTVELSRACLRDPRIEREIVGRVEAIEPDPEEAGFLVTVGYPLEITALDPAQLLGVAFGNASLQRDVALVDLDPPDRLLEALGGPRFGIEGLRAATGVRGRPLTCAALKPMGLSPDALAARCRAIARGGVDVIKDDHGLADHPFCPFEARVRSCAEAIERVADATGRRAVYAANLVGTPSALRERLRIAEDIGAGAVVVAPMIVGLPAFHELVSLASVPVVAHPALAGGSAIRPTLLVGGLFRLYGADAVVFPHAGGRFPDWDAGRCRDLADRLRRPTGSVRPALPVPAGGMGIERVAGMVEFYGSDAMLLVGGTLYRADGLEARTRTFVERVGEAAIRASGAAS